MQWCTRSLEILDSSLSVGVALNIAVFGSYLVGIGGGLCDVLVRKKVGSGETQF